MNKNVAPTCIIRQRKFTSSNWSCVVLRYFFWCMARKPKQMLAQMANDAVCIDSINLCSSIAVLWFATVMASNAGSVFVSFDDDVVEFPHVDNKTPKIKNMILVPSMVDSLSTFHNIAIVVVVMGSEALMVSTKCAELQLKAILDAKKSPALHMPHQIKLEYLEWYHGNNRCIRSVSNNSGFVW